jgi:hypothetical protein
VKSAAVLRFEDMPNIGPAMAADFRLLGLKKPSDLAGRDPWALYRALCRKTRSRQDPCVLDTFMAAVAFAETGDRRPWWAWTKRRKALYGERLKSSKKGATLKPG